MKRSFLRIILNSKNWVSPFAFTEEEERLHEFIEGYWIKYIDGFEELSYKNQEKLQVVIANRFKYYKRLQKQIWTDGLAR